jgi:hypothetical protein
MQPQNMSGRPRKSVLIIFPRRATSREKSKNKFVKMQRLLLVFIAEAPAVT